MSGKIRRVLPHLVILICNMYIVFFLIDRVNTAMNFIDNNLTKVLILIMSVAGISNAMYYIRVRRSGQRHNAAPARQPSYDGGRNAGSSGPRYGSGRGHGAGERGLNGSGRSYRAGERDYSRTDRARPGERYDSRRTGMGGYTTRERRDRRY